MTTPSNSKVLNSVLWAVIRVWGNRFGGILIFFILARLLSPEEMGVYSAIWAILLFLEVFTEQGLADAIIQRSTIEKNQLNTVFIVNLSMAIIISIAIILSADKIAALINMPKIANPLKVATLSLIFNALGFCQLALYRRNFEYRWLAVRTLSATVISGIVGITMAFQGYGAWALIIQFILAALINMIWLWVRPIWTLSFDFTLKGLRELMQFSSKLMFARLCDATSTRVFEFAIGAWLGAATLGVFSVGSRIYTIMLQLLSNVVLDVAHSGFSRLAEDKAKFLDGYYKAVMVTVGLALPAFVILSAVAHEFCVGLFGARWVESGDILHVLALLGAVQAVQSINIAAIGALGFSGVQFAVAFMKALVTVAVLLLYGHGGLKPLVFAYFIVQLPLCPISFILGKKYINFSWKALTQKIYPFVVATTLAYYGIAYIKYLLHIDRVWLSLTILSSSGLLIYIASISIIKPVYFNNIVQYARNKRMKS